MSNFFQHKDKTPKTWCSNIVYKYDCATCNSCYIGSTKRQCFVRVAEHCGKSYRTGQYISRPSQSAIRDHSEKICNKQVNIDEFSILYKGNYLTEIRIAESLMIKAQKPNLNNELSSFPLEIF